MHDWHLFDELQQLEVRGGPGAWEVRRVGGVKTVTLTDAEWEQVREPGPDPELMAELDDGS